MMLLQLPKSKADKTELTAFQAFPALGTVRVRIQR